MEFILAIQLVIGGPVERIPVHDCRDGVVWLHDAWRWAERSRIDFVDGPLYVCYPAELKLEVVRR